jgi:hypothetical protein
LLLIPLSCRQGDVKEISLHKYRDKPAINGDTVATVGAQAFVRLRLGEIFGRKLLKRPFGRVPAACG